MNPRQINATDEISDAKKTERFLNNRAGMAARAAQPQYQVGSGQISGTGGPSSLDRIVRNPAAEAAANGAVSNSTVPLNINTPNALAAGAIAASPKPFIPTSEPLHLPNQKLSPYDDSQDAAALSRNLEMMQPGGLRKYAQAPTIIPTTPMPYEARQSNPAPGSVTTTTPAAKPFIASTGRAMNEDGSFSSEQFDRTAAHNSLAKTNPQIWTAGSPENLAFIQHAKDRMAAGLSREEAINEAYRNAPAIMAKFTPQVTGKPVTGTATSKRGGADLWGRTALNQTPSRPNLVNPLN